jgi:hypothetical protein
MSVTVSRESQISITIVYDRQSREPNIDHDCLWPSVMRANRESQISITTVYDRQSWKPNIEVLKPRSWEPNAANYNIAPSNKLVRNNSVCFKKYIYNNGLHKEDSWTHPIIFSKHRMRSTNMNITSLNFFAMYGGRRGNLKNFWPNIVPPNVLNKVLVVFSICSLIIFLLPTFLINYNFRYFWKNLTLYK